MGGGDVYPLSSTLMIQRSFLEILSQLVQMVQSKSQRMWCCIGVRVLGTTRDIRWRLGPSGPHLVMLGEISFFRKELNELTTLL